MVLESIGLAAGQFALKFVSGGIQDRALRTQLEAAYTKAAEDAIEHFTAPQRPLGSESWNRIASLTRNQDFAMTLGFGGDVGNLDLVSLQATYGQDEPPLEDILYWMLDDIQRRCQAVLPTDSQVLAQMIRTHGVLQRVRDERLQQGLDRNTDALNVLTATVMDQYSAVIQNETTVSPANALPTDDDYRVERPELADLAQRLTSEEVVGIGAVGVGGEGGVGKSLLAVHYARENFPENTLYVSLDSGSIETIMFDLGRGVGIELDANRDTVTNSRVLGQALAAHDGLLVLDNAEDLNQTRMLLPDPGGACRTILTSRDQSLLRALTGSEPVMMEIFTPDQAPSK